MEHFEKLLTILAELEQHHELKYEVECAYNEMAGHPLLYVTYSNALLSVSRCVGMLDEAVMHYSEILGTRRKDASLRQANELWWTGA